MFSFLRRQLLQQQVGIVFLFGGMVGISNGGVLYGTTISKRIAIKG